jgi:uncharacterized protein with GYD domain
MPTYILLSKLTPKGRETIKERPDRIKEVDMELENMGVKVVEQYATLGPYDFVNVVEAPDNETISKVSVELSSRGTVEIMTLPAVPVESFISSVSSLKKMLKKTATKKKATKAKGKSRARKK